MAEEVVIWKSWRTETACGVREMMQSEIIESCGFPGSGTVGSTRIVITEKIKRELDKGKTGSKKTEKYLDA